MVFLAVALSIDALAVALAVSAAGHTRARRAIFRISFHFGLFQFLMPVLGWAAGTTIEPLIAPIDHWVAFVLLVAVGMRMLLAKPQAASSRLDDPTRGVMLVTLSTATSIDALAVGLSLAMLGVPIWLPSITIGLVTGILSLLAILTGARVGPRLGRRAEMVGGVLLMLIAVRIVASEIVF